jgi:hypothetical protein
MRIECNRFPGGVQKALTMSYDDGPPDDRRLVELFDRHGIRGAFHLNSGTLGQPGHIGPDEVSTLFVKHEISVHSLTHPFLDNLPPERIIAEILEDRKNLEALAGYPVRGMSYPYGAFDARVLDLLPRLGIEYARVVPTTGEFNLPENFLRWQGTCHHADRLIERGEQFLDLKNRPSLSLLYVWGHSFEFKSESDWNQMEEFCRLLGKRGDIWYATNIEIVDYVNALRSVKFSADCSLAYNPSALIVWVSVDGGAVAIPGGKIVRLK